MPKEKTAESQTEKLTHEKFLNRLYHSIVGWQRGKGAQVIREFEPQTIEDWDHHSDSPGPGVDFDLDLKKGVLLKRGNMFFGVALGVSYRSKWDPEPKLRLHFGFRKVSKDDPRAVRIINYSDPQEFKRLVSKRFLNYQAGEFYVHPRSNRLSIHCWTDDWPYGGKEIGRRWSEEELLTENGLRESLHLVQEMVRRSQAN